MTSTQNCFEDDPFWAEWSEGMLNSLQVLLSLR